MIHIFEHSGVMLRVDYTPGEEPTFHSIHVMDASYRPIGPDLTQLLHKTVLLDDEPVEGQLANAQPFLSAICEELP